MATVKYKNSIYISIILIGVIVLLVQHQQSIVELYMRYALRHEYIVVSLTTTPYRINKLSDNIKAIQNQTAPIARIYLSVPHHFKRDNIPYVIPEFISNNPLITIIRSSDYGPATKLLGLLASVTLPAKAIIITLDDDIKYPSNIVLHLAYHASLDPNQAFGLSGADLYNEGESVKKIDRRLGLKSRYNYNGSVQILQGYAGVAYRRAFFNNDVFNITSLSANCIASDDLYFSWYLETKHIPRQSIANSYISTKFINPDNKLALGNDALQMQIPGMPEKVRSCAAELRALSSLSSD